MLQSNHTSGALEGLSICVAMFSMWAMWFKKYLNRFGEPAFSRLTSIRPKPGNETIGVPTKMSHLYCFGSAKSM